MSISLQHSQPLTMQMQMNGIQYQPQYQQKQPMQQQQPQQQQQFQQPSIQQSMPLVPGGVPTTKSAAGVNAKLANLIQKSEVPRMGGTVSPNTYPKPHDYPYGGRRAINFPTEMPQMRSAAPVLWNVVNKVDPPVPLGPT